MTDETRELRRGLEQIANTPRQRPQLDITAPAVRGRRILRAWRVRAVAGSAGAVGLVATLMATDLPRLGAEPDRPAVRPNAVTYPNPLVQRAAFGWLPKGYTTRTVIEDHQNGRHTFEMLADGGRLGIVDMTDFGAGPEPILGHLSGGRPAQPLPAAPVNGQQAHWITSPGAGGESKLRWEYGKQRWAEIAVQGSADASTVYRIARSITFGIVRPTALPFQVKGLPAGLTIYRSAAGPGIGSGSGDSADISFAAGAYTPNNWLDISLTPAGVMARQSAGDPGRRITVDGHRAIDRRTMSGGVARHTLIVMGVNGFDVFVQAAGQVLQRLEATGGVAGLYHRIAVLGADPARWTTTPLA